MKAAYPIIENTCKRLVEHLNKRIEAGETTFVTQDVRYNTQNIHTKNAENSRKHRKSSKSLNLLLNFLVDITSSRQYFVRHLIRY